MANSKNSPLAFVAEVARYLSVEPNDVQAMMEKDRLPFTSIPRRTRTAKRVPLRDFHAWLKKRSPDAPILASYETFLADFNDAARKQTA